MSLVTLTGLLAAMLTTTSAIPQVLKCWRTRSSHDISLLAVSMQALGQGLWIAYGVFRSDAVIIVANIVSVMLTLNLVGFKIHEWRKGASIQPPSSPATAATRPGETVRPA